MIFLNQENALLNLETKWNMTLKLYRKFAYMDSI